MRFEDFMAELTREAQFEGSDAVEELEGLRLFFSRDLRIDAVAEPAGGGGKFGS